MAKLDAYAEFADAVDVTATETDAQVGDSYDLGSTGLNLGATDAWFVVKIQDAVTSNSAVTCTFRLISDAQTALTPATATEHFSTGAIAKATLVAGYKVCAVKLPAGTYERFLGVTVSTSGGTLLTGTMNAYLTLDEPNWKAYPDGL